MEPMDVDSESDDNIRQSPSGLTETLDLWEGLSIAENKNPVRSNKKPRCGIPDGEETFSHFPEYNKVNSQPKNMKVRAKRSGIPEDEEKIHERTTEKSPANQGLCSKCFTMLKLLFVLFVSVLMLALFLENLITRCKLSRQFDRDRLGKKLQSSVFGQHLAVDIVPKEIEKFFHKFNAIQEVGASWHQKMCKPLVLSFHGWTGVGKNYVAKFVEASFQASVVSYYNIPLHFPHSASDQAYSFQIEQWILGNITWCSVNVIVIDEMDKAFPGVTSGIAQTITALTQPSFRMAPVVFLLISNTHAVDLNRNVIHYYSLATSTTREDILEEMFTKIFDSDIEWYSPLKNQNVIDAFVPFLPLEKSHVIQCIQRELTMKKFSANVENVISKVLDELSFSTYGDIEVCNTGCKRVADKVDYVMLNPL